MLMASKTPAPAQSAQEAEFWSVAQVYNDLLSHLPEPATNQRAQAMDAALTTWTRYAYGQVEPKSEYTAQLLEHLHSRLEQEGLVCI